MFKIFGKMLAKSFFLQSLWNFERLQNIGFLFILKPFLDKIYPDKEKRKEAMMRHTGFFNTHPYMANIIIAVTANAEKQIAENKNNEKNLPDINALKSITAGPLAAIGDSFFWGTVRPITAFLSILLVILLTRVMNPIYGLIAPLVFIVAYNSVHLTARYWMFFISLKFDKETLGVISKLEIQFLGDMARYAGLIVVIAALFCYFKFFGFAPSGITFFSDILPDAYVYGIVLVPAILLGRMNATFMFYCVILFSILMSYLGI